MGYFGGIFWDLGFLGGVFWGLGALGCVVEEVMEIIGDLWVL